MHTTIRIALGCVFALASFCAGESVVGTAAHLSNVIVVPGRETDRMSVTDARRESEAEAFRITGWCPTCHVSTF